MSVKRFLFFPLLLFIFFSVNSQSYDSLQVSLLTVSPHSRAVWTIFGHTALRLHDPVRKIDAVCNWGTFDFGQPNFILHFIEGKTDYFLSASNFESVMHEHADERATVTEQILNIPENEKGPLLESLQFNLLPENSEYRYNFIFDNCTTRPHDFIERFCGGTIIYPEQRQAVTFRRLIHQCTRLYPWLEAGIDCVIGSGADSLISFRNELFLPEKLMDALNRSVVKHPDGSEQPIVLTTEVILQSPDSQPERLNFWYHPLTIGWILFIFYLALSITAYYKYHKKSNRLSAFTFQLLPFTLLFLVAGAGGCIVFMLNFFSLHPCVQSNWNLLWLHPLHFIAVAGFFSRKSYRLIRWYHAANFVLLSCFLLGWHWIPQELNRVFIPFILCLWVVSGLNWVYRYCEGDSSKGKSKKSD